MTTECQSSVVTTAKAKKVRERTKFSLLEREMSLEGVEVSKDKSKVILI